MFPSLSADLPSCDLPLLFAQPSHKTIASYYWSNSSQSVSFVFESKHVYLFFLCAGVWRPPQHR